MKPAIRFIVQTWSAWHKTNGYHTRLALITSTQTGKYLYVTDVGGDENARGAVFRAIDYQSSPLGIVHEINVTEMRRRERSIGTHHAEHSTAEHSLTPEMILALEEV